MTTVSTGCRKEREPQVVMDRRKLMLGAGALGLLAASEPAWAADIPTPMPAAWTRAPQFPLWPNGAPGRDRFRPLAEFKNWPPTWLHNTPDPSLRMFRPARSNGRAILVIPGGAFLFVSANDEGVRVAAPLNRLGYTVFVLSYRLPTEGWADRANVPLQDAQRAMRLIRSQAKSYRVDGATVSVLGFSAGGHLAATLATSFEERVYAPVDHIDAADARPAAAGLIYPVITMSKPLTHEGSRANLLGNNPPDDLVFRRSADLRVGPNTPPTFLAHAIDDPIVSADNSLLMHAAMRTAKRPVELHLLQEGGHGFGPGVAGTPSSLWPMTFDRWLNRTIPNDC